MEQRDRRQLQRYTSRPFPSYRYIPFQGDMPHPRNDPDGHSYGREDDYLPEFSARQWMDCQPYLYGVDLFNRGYWWEAHEAWENVWLAAGRGTRTGMFIQGLIQIAAAQLKRVMHEDQGAKLLTASGIEKLNICKGQFLGIDIARLTAQAEAALQQDVNLFAPVITLSLPPKS